MAFISLIDDRAIPKGSRDPLGFELVWTHFGRNVIGNLTTITSSMDNFAVALLGYYFANDLVPKNENDNERHRQIRELFIRYEQLAGYVRYYGNANNIMGITRVKQRLNDKSFELTLGQSADQLILSDQASYGLWGLYSSASRDSGLVEGDNREVSERGRGLEIVNEIQNNLGDCADQIRKLINSDDIVLDRTHLESMAEKFMNAIQHRKVRSNLLEVLLAGHNPNSDPNSDPNGVQIELWKITQDIHQKYSELPEDIDTFINLVFELNPRPDLRKHLEDIQQVERLLVACNNLFRYCRRKDGEKLANIQETLVNRYTYSHLPDSLPEDNFPRKSRVARILEAFHNNDVLRAIKELINLNKEVMQDRSGAPWVEIESGDKLRVKIKSERAELAEQKDIETHWNYDYFLGSFLRIARNHLGNIR